MKRTLKLIPLLLAAAVVFETPAAAWSGPGHAAVAAAAYGQLSDEARRRALLDVLRSHPKFAEWETEFNALNNAPSDLDLGTFVFIRASTWPDTLRGEKDKALVEAWDHPSWHYVNYPLRLPDFGTEDAGPEPHQDILAGIGASRKFLANKKADPVARAVYLSWMLHLVGDIHQPLHCVALIGGGFKPPKGDQGGNFFLVYRSKKAKNADPKGKNAVKLHSYWDQQLGASLHPNAVKAFGDAAALVSEHARDSLDELAAGDNHRAWSLESRDLASESGYRLNGTRLTRKGVLPFGYAKSATTIARRRLALAGYRLHDEMLKVAF